MGILGLIFGFNQSENNTGIKYFDFQPSLTDTVNVESEYISFLKLVTENFGLGKIKDFEINYTNGLTIYSEPSDDMRIIIKTDSGDYVHRFYDYIKPHFANFLNLYYKNYNPISESINRYLIENGSNNFVSIRSTQPVDSSLLNLRVYFSKRGETLDGEEVSLWDNYPVKNTIKNALDRFDLYQRAGLLDMLDTNEINNGIKLIKEYNFINSQDVLWCFKNLIVPCSPRESGGYKSELESFFKITHEKLRFTNYKEESNNGKTDISFMLNDIPFEIKNLPTEFSLRFIKELNKVLQKIYNTSFFVWTWDRNPWEQQCFIYLDIDTFIKSKQILTDIRELDDRIIEFYDEN